MHRKLLPAIAGAVTFILMFAIAGVVYGQGGDAAPAEPSLASRVAELAFKILAPIVTMLAAWLVHRLVALLEKKTGIEIPEREEAMIDKWVREGVHLVEEWSFKKIKAGTEKLTGPEKLEKAGDYVMDLVAARGLADWTRERVNKKLESWIGIERANGGKPTLDDIELGDDDEDDE